MNHGDYTLNHMRCPNTRLLADPRATLGFAVPGTLPVVVRLAILLPELAVDSEKGVARPPLRENSLRGVVITDAVLFADSGAGLTTRVLLSQV